MLGCSKSRCPRSRLEARAPVLRPVVHGGPPTGASSRPLEAAPARRRGNVISGSPLASSGEGEVTSPRQKVVLNPMGRANAPVGRSPCTRGSEGDPQAWRRLRLHLLFKLAVGTPRSCPTSTLDTYIFTYYKLPWIQPSFLILSKVPSQVQPPLTP